MDAFPLAFLCLLAVCYATKEDVSHGSSHSNSEVNHFLELIKRLGNSDEDLDRPNFPQNTRDQCTTTKVTRNSIIKSTASIAAGAKYVSSHKKISSLTECSKLCCEESECDTAIYQENKEQHCYLFACQDVCEFTEHTDYSRATIEHIKPIPSQQQHEEEAQLENLHGSNGDVAAPEQTPERKGQDENVQEEEVTVTLAPTPPPKPYVAPHTAGINGFCTTDSSCEDPNAGCYEEKCGCRQGYYNKAGLCRKICPESDFECLKLGSLTRGPECVASVQVCDSYMQCADGSDEFNCEASDNQPPEISRPSSMRKNKDNQPPEISHSNSMRKNKDENQGSMPQGPANPSVPLKSRPVIKEELSKTRTQSPPVAQTSVSIQRPAAPSNKTSGVSKVNRTDQATSKPLHHSVGSKEQVFLSREKVIIASSSSEAEGPIIALSLGLAFTMILIGLLACRLRNMKHRLRKGRPLNSNEADYLINGMYL